PPPAVTLCPYTTLFRSHQHGLDDVLGEHALALLGPPLLEGARALEPPPPRTLATGERVHPLGVLGQDVPLLDVALDLLGLALERDRKSTRLNSSHVKIS